MLLQLADYYPLIFLAPFLVLALVWGARRYATPRLDSRKLAFYSSPKLRNFIRPQRSQFCSQNSLIFFSIANNLC